MYTSDYYTHFRDEDLENLEYEIDLLKVEQLFNFRHEYECRCYGLNVYFHQNLCAEALTPHVTVPGWNL